MGAIITMNFFLTRMWRTKYIFYDGMSCVGIAAGWMNCFKGSLYNFANVLQGFLRQHTFQTSKSNLVRRTVLHKVLNSTLWAPKCSDSDSWQAAHGPMKLHRQLKGCSPAAACKSSQWYRLASLYNGTDLQVFVETHSDPSLRRTVILKKPSFCSCSFSVKIWFNSYSTHHMHTLFCRSVGLILN